MSEKQRYSGIGGQAVMGGMMMRNENLYSVAVRLSDGSIESKKEELVPWVKRYPWLNLPIVRGVVSFVESMSLGMGLLNWAYDTIEKGEKKIEEGEEKEEVKQEAKKASAWKDQIFFIAVLLVALAVAITLFTVLPVFLASLLRKLHASDTLVYATEGILKLLIFLGYLMFVGCNKESKTLFQYHGAEHKCINCIEHGHPLTVENVMKSSRFHKRCGTSFLVFVLLLSLVIFIFVRIPSPPLRILLRVLTIPVLAGLAYEILRLAGKKENAFVRILSLPGLWMQRLTTKEPDASMCELAIFTVEEVFDWKKFLEEGQKGQSA